MDVSRSRTAPAATSNATVTQLPGWRVGVTRIQPFGWSCNHLKYTYAATGFSTWREPTASSRTEYSAKEQMMVDNPTDPRWYPDPDLWLYGGTPSPPCSPLYSPSSTPLLCATPTAGSTWGSAATEAREAAEARAAAETLASLRGAIAIF
jgi:hypothetical protein